MDSGKAYALSPSKAPCGLCRTLSKIAARMQIQAAKTNKKKAPCYWWAFFYQ